MWTTCTVAVDGFGALRIEREYIERPTNGPGLEYMPTGQTVYFLDDQPVSADVGWRFIARAAAAAS